MGIEQAEETAGRELRGFAGVALSMRWLSLVIVYLGMLMVNQFFAQWALGRFGASGFETYVNSLEMNANVDRFTRSALGFLADNSHIFAPLLAVLVGVTGLACMLLLWRPIVAFAVSIFF